MSLSLILLFLGTAVLYASVGFGGGSTYTALLILYGTDYRILPTIALVCNIIVVSGGVWRFSKAGQINLKRLWPFLVTSIPAAWVGGQLPVSEIVFIGLLSSSLFISGLRLLFSRSYISPIVQQAVNTPIAVIIGAMLGLLSGIVGIGGGIFLAPILYFMKWGTSRQIAAACSLFILLNSMSGLGGQVMKLNDLSLTMNAFGYWPLILSVFIGGQIGSWFGAIKFPQLWMKRITAILILYVSIRLLWRWMTMLTQL
ncbi:MAG: sulfite exporter TauE/SafE family protein [Pseudomonadota bacterium]